VEGEGRGAIREEALAAPAPGFAHVRTRYSGISRGTEALVWSGRVPASERDRMRCPFQSGDFPFPVKYGYASVGRVLTGPPELAGRAVFCLHPHQTEYVVPAAALVPLPSAVPEERGILAANLETALNAVWDAQLRPGDRVSVVGAGVVGALVAHVASRIAAVEVELVDVNPARRELAAALGVGFSSPDAATRERDVVFHVSASAEGLGTALSLPAHDGSVIELSWFGDREVPLALGERFHSARLTLRSSQVGTVSPYARRRFTPRARLELALALLADDRLDALIDGESPFEALPEVMSAVTRATPPGLCHRIRYES
jgi:threonine dehydrogenase-like Zn-dependent dehydrogenase